MTGAGGRGRVFFCLDGSFLWVTRKLRTISRYLLTRLVRVAEMLAQVCRRGGGRSSSAERVNLTAGFQTQTQVQKLPSLSIPNCLGRVSSFPLLSFARRGRRVNWPSKGRRLNPTRLPTSPTLFGPWSIGPRMLATSMAMRHQNRNSNQAAPFEVNLFFLPFPLGACCVADRRWAPPAAW